MKAHGGCDCAAEPGPVNTYVCSCTSAATWQCVIAVDGGACSNACLGDANEGPSDDAGDAGSCGQTASLALAKGVPTATWAPDGTLSVRVTLSNNSDSRYEGFPGIEVTSDSPDLMPTNGVGSIAYNSVSEIAAQQTVELLVVFRAPASAPCVAHSFHIQVRSFDADGKRCGGEVTDVAVVPPPLDNGNCPACPEEAPSLDDPCETGLYCLYGRGKDPTSCWCEDSSWSCVSFL
jgi:hypothetical protein